MFNEINKDNAVILMHGEIKNLERLNEFIANTNAFAKKRKPRNQTNQNQIS